MSGGLVFGRVRGRRFGRWGLVGAVVAVAVLAAGCGVGQGEAGLPPGAEGPSFDEGPPFVVGGPSDAGEPSEVEDGILPPDGYVWYPGLGRLDAPGGVFADVAVGGVSSCGVRDDGRVVCWGEQEEAGRVVQNAPVGGEFEAVVVWQVGDDYYDGACGLRVDGAVVCWGLVRGFAGVAAVVARSGGDDDYPVRWELRSGSGASEGFVGIDAGAGGVCAVRGDGSAGCWDGNGWSRDGLPAGEFAEVVVSGVVCGLRPGGGFGCAGGEEPAFGLPEGEFADVSAGLGFGCGVRVGGALVCWGDNEDGQADPPLGQYTQVSAGEAHACALDVGGRAVCWGDNERGQADAPGGEFAQVAARWSWFSCGLRPDGEQVCWGASDPPSRLAADVERFCERVGGEPVCWDADMSWANRDSWDLATSRGEGQLAHIVRTPFHDDVVCGLRPDRTAACWGNHRVLESPGGEFVSLVNVWPWKLLPDWLFCGLRADRSAVCWDYEDQDSLGQRRLAVSSLDGRFADIDGRGRCGISAETGEISCWGSESTGAVGAAPESVLPLLGVSGGGGVFCGISAADRSLACWPHHSRARLEVPGLPGGELADVSVGPSGAGCAITVGQELVCWGRFGDVDQDIWGPANVSISLWEPVRVFNGRGGEVDPPQGRYTKVDVGARHACAIEVGGAVACWGHAHDWPYDYRRDRGCERGEECPD